MVARPSVSKTSKHACYIGDVRVRFCFPARRTVVVELRYCIASRINSKSSCCRITNDLTLIACYALGAAANLCCGKIKALAVWETACYLCLPGASNFERFAKIPPHCFIVAHLLKCSSLYNTSHRQPQDAENSCHDHKPMVWCIDSGNSVASWQGLLRDSPFGPQPRSHTALDFRK